MRHALTALILLPLVAVEPAIPPERGFAPGDLALFATGTKQTVVLIGRLDAQLSKQAKPIGRGKFIFNEAGLAGPTLAGTGLKLLPLQAVATKAGAAGTRIDLWGSGTTRSGSLVQFQLGLVYTVHLIPDIDSPPSGTLSVTTKDGRSEMIAFTGTPTIERILPARAGTATTAAAR